MVPETLGDVVLAANELRAKGVGTVLVSLGARGAVLVKDSHAFHAESGVIVPRSTVGAGDALLAGFLAAGGEGPDALAEGVAWGAAACVLPGTAVPGPGDLQRDLVKMHPGRSRAAVVTRWDGGGGRPMPEARVKLRNPTGLHARPAKIFAKAAAAFPADVVVEKDGRRVNAKSTLSLLTLDCHQGDEILISVEGEAADETLAELVGLVEAGIGGKRVEEGRHVSTRLSGRAAAPGAAVAPAFVLAPQPVLTKLPEVASGAPEDEHTRLLGALERAEAELRELAERVAASAGEEEGEIFEAHAEFAADPELARLTEEAVRAGASAERAVVGAFETFRELLVASASEYSRHVRPTSTTSVTGS